MLAMRSCSEHSKSLFLDHQTEEDLESVLDNPE